MNPILSLEYQIITQIARNVSIAISTSANIGKGVSDDLCSICLNTPCLSGCPNAPEPKIVTKCDECGEYIRDGDVYYRICDLNICEECVSADRREAEYEEDDDSYSTEYVFY